MTLTKAGMGVTLIMCLCIMGLLLSGRDYTSIAAKVLEVAFYAGFFLLIIFSIAQSRKADYDPIFSKYPQMKLSSANFHYTIENYGNSLNYIKIVDFGGPFLSVTNDIENIVDDIIRWEKITDMSEYLIIYKDSDDQWDAWDYQKKDFVYLGQDNALDAAKHYHSYINEGSNELYERAE